MFIEVNCLFPKTKPSENEEYRRVLEDIGKSDPEEFESDKISLNTDHISSFNPSGDHEGKTSVLILGNTDVHYLIDEPYDEFKMRVHEAQFVSDFDIKASI